MARVTDVRALVLADGREVVLAGVDVPEAGRGTLETLMTGRRILLRPAGRPSETDRHGRLPAHVTVEGADLTLQQQLLGSGRARVSGRVGEPACASELLAAERPAREAQLGIWADPAYAPRRADRGDEFAGDRGHFVVAGGKILSVREVGGTIYMNFGRRWSRGLTVTIRKRDERAFAAAGLSPKSLAYRHVRVRGWVEERNGPHIEARRPEQIEIADTP